MIQYSIWIHSRNEARNNGFSLCSVADQIPLPGYGRAPVFFSCESAGIMKSLTHCNIDGQRGSISLWGMMDILPAEPFFAHVANVAAKPFNLLKFLTVVFESNAPTCTIHAGDDESYMPEEEDQILTQCPKFNPNPKINGVGYKVTGWWNKRVDHHFAVEN